MNRSPLARLTLVLALVSLFGLAAAQSECAPGGEQTPGPTGLAKGLLDLGAALRDVQESLCRLYVLTGHERELPRFCPRPPGVCELPIEPGPCRAAIPRWFHDPRTNRCELFTWGGCGGNANRFSSLAECEQACPSCREALCLPHQECRLYQEPACPSGTSCAPEAYCADPAP